MVFFFSSRRRHTRSLRDWSSDVCSSDLLHGANHRPGLRRSDRPTWGSVASSVPKKEANDMSRMITRTHSLLLAAVVASALGATRTAAAEAARTDQGLGCALSTQGGG